MTKAKVFKSYLTIAISTEHQISYSRLVVREKGYPLKRFRRVHIEITNVCNLQCSFCPEVERDDQYMQPDLFRKIMQQVAPLTDEVCLHLMGEPLGHPKLESLVDICAELQTPINLTTNGLLINGQRARLLLHPIFRQINISVQSFEANFPRRDPSAYMQKLFRFVKEAAAERPDLYINFRLWDLAEPGQEVESNRGIRTLIGEEYGIDLSQLTPDPRRKKGYLLAGRTYVNFDSRFEWPSLAAPERSARGTCHGLSNHFGIHGDGTVVPCCLDKEAVIRLGNLQHEDINKVLAAPRATSIREGFKAFELREELCRHCDFIKRFDRKPARRSQDRAPAKTPADAAPH